MARGSIGLNDFSLTGLRLPTLNLTPRYGSKVPKSRLCRVSIVGIVVMVLARCLIVVYLDP